MKGITVLSMMQVLKYICIFLVNLVGKLTSTVNLTFRCAGKMLPQDIRLLLERTAALDEYALFTALAAIIISSVSSLFNLSNHVIISLDIIYLATILMLVMYNIFKEPDNLLFVTI